MLKQSVLFIFSLFIILACQNQEYNNESTKKVILKSTLSQESIPIVNESDLDLTDSFPPCGFDPIEDIIPNGYKLIRSFHIDIDNDSIDEVLIHCLSNQPVECELVEDSNCFMDVLLLVEVDPDWRIIKKFNVPKPSFISHQKINLSIDSNKSVVLKFNYAPVNPSNVTTYQYYSYFSKEFVIDSISHTVGTKMGGELLLWKYKFDFVNKKIDFHYSKQDVDNELDEEENKKQDTTFVIQVDTLLNISDSISISRLIPEGIEKPYY